MHGCTRLLLLHVHCNEKWRGAEMATKGARRCAFSLHTLTASSSARRLAQRSAFVQGAASVSTPPVQCCKQWSFFKMAEKAATHAPIAQEKAQQCAHTCVLRQRCHQETAQNQSRRAARCAVTPIVGRQLEELETRCGRVQRHGDGNQQQHQQARVSGEGRGGGERRLARAATVRTWHETTDPSPARGA